MNPISMSTRDLRAILREAEAKEPGVAVRVAADIYGPGGSVFIAANSKLTERHLVWLEQRNPAADTKPTYVDIIITQERRSSSDFARAVESADSVTERRRRSSEISRDVVVKADDVAKKATEVYRIVGEQAFTTSALRNREVIENLSALNSRIQMFHTSVRAAIDEYLVGNTLIMDLIARHDLATRTVQHSLSVAVFAAELSSQVLLKGAARLKEGSALAKDLAEIFLGGFMHDCGLWNESDAAVENHEAAGAKLIWHIPEIGDFLPSLTKIVLFHSDIIRIAGRPGLVEIVEQPDKPGKTVFKAEFYRSEEEAQTASSMRGGNSQATMLTEDDLHKVIPVAVSEYCITQTEGFSAKSRSEVVDRLVGYEESVHYLDYVVALCNAQVEVIAPRRSYVELTGGITGSGKEISLDGFEGGSMWHSDDIYSPHLITLFGPGQQGGKHRLNYVSPHDGQLWARPLDSEKRLYIPAGRHKGTLGLRVTGFMSEDVYENILGEYEMELKRQMQA